MQAPSTAARKPSAGAEGNSACGENEKPSPSGSKQPTPTTTAAEKSNQSAANQEKKGRQAAQAAPAKIRLFDFASYSGPQVPVIPDSGNPEVCVAPFSQLLRLLKQLDLRAFVHCLFHCGLGRDLITFCLGKFCGG